MAEQQLNVTISVIDRASARLRAINERVSAFSSPLRLIGTRMRELAEETGLNRVGERASGALEHVRELHRGLSEILAPVAALTAGFSVAGLAEIVKQTAEMGEQLTLTSRATGIGVTALGGWQYAARLANVDQAQLNRGLMYFNRTISEAARGKAKDAEIILGRLGLNNAPGHLVNTAAGLRSVAAAAKQLVDTGQTQLASDMMSKLFGSRSGTLLLPLFAQGPEHLQELFDEAAKHGQAMTTQQAEQAAKFEENYKQMSSAVEGLRYAIAEDLFPTLTPIIARMTDWIDANRQWLATNIGAAVQQIGDKLRSIDWSAVGGWLATVGRDIGWVIDRVGGLGVAIGLIAAIKLSPMILAFGQLGVAAVRSLAVISAALTAFAIGNPIVAATLAIAGIGLAAYEIYRHWDTIEPLLAGILNKLGDTAQIVGDRMLAALEGAVNYAWDRWRAFVDWLDSHVPSWLSRAWTGGQGGAAGPAPGGASPPPGGAAAVLPLSGAGGELARRLYAEARSRGLDREHALALLGNAYAESGLRAAALGDYENGIPTSFGLFQEHNERMRDMLRTLGPRAKDPLAQLDYAIDEMRRRDAGWFGQSGSPRDLTNSFERSFERPSNVVDRGAFADRIASALDKPIGGAGPAVASPLDRPIGRAGSAAAGPAKGQVDVKVTVDHRNPPPGVTTRVEQPDPLDLNLGQAFGY